MKYQDFVIKDGKFIGDFEQMYKKFDNPWHQADTENVDFSFSRNAVACFINKYGIKSLVEFGCGLGFTSNFLKTNTKVDLLGIDISPTCIKKAQKNFPEIKFKTDTIDNIDLYQDYEAFFFSEISWYLLENNTINKVFDSMRMNLKGKFLIHNLVFYKENQQYGKDYFSSPEEFIHFCPFELLGKVEVNIKNSNVIETSMLFKI